MLHPRIIAKLKDACELRTGVKLVEYPVEKCTKVYDHFNSIVKSDGKKTWYQRPGQTAEEFQMEKWESDWIRNELLMCRCSFEYWLYRYFFLKDISGFIRRPDSSVAWYVALDILREIDGERKPMLLLFLKARQLGISTLVEAIIIWIALFRKGSFCVISSAEEEKSVKMSEMVWRALDYLPIWMKPVMTGEDKSKGPEFGYIESAISIQHGSMKKGIGRGDTPVAAHLSECAWYPDPINTIESSLFKAMHENKRSFLALESTAKKKGDWWNKLWNYNREMESKGMNKFICIFLPWYVGLNIYPTPDWMLNHPIPKEWKPNANTMKQANNAALYVASTPLLRKHMGDKWKMPLSQQWFYEFEHTQASRSDESLKSFLAEMASDEREAFQSKRWAVYSYDVLERLEKNLEGVKYVDYAFTGNGIDPRWHLKEYQSHSAKRVTVTTADMEGNPVEWKLIPLRETPEEDDLSFYIRIWELPKKGYKYTCAIDVAGGLGLDATVVDVIRVGNNYEPDVQVAQMWCPYLSSVEIPPFVHCVGILYGQHMSPIPEALMCPELVLSTGDAISHQLNKMGYSNWHYEKRYDRTQSPGHKGRMRGWATRSYTRQMMLETLKMAVDAGWIIINSARTVQELAEQESEETDSGKTKWDHADNEHDDCIFSLGIAYFCSHDEEALAERSKGKKPKVEAEVEVGNEPQKDSAEAWIARRFARDDDEFLGREDDTEIASVW
jgi:hypothetical protein